MPSPKLEKHRPEQSPEQLTAPSARDLGSTTSSLIGLPGSGIPGIQNGHKLLSGPTCYVLRDADCFMGAMKHRILRNYPDGRRE